MTRRAPLDLARIKAYPKTGDTVLVWRSTWNALIDLAERAEAAEAKLARVEALAERLAASVLLLAHDAHPTYGNTTGWRGGIGGQTITDSCSVIDPPPGANWTQFGLPTTEARKWYQEHPFDLEATKATLKAEWTAALDGPS